MPFRVSRVTDKAIYLKRIPEEELEKMQEENAVKNDPFDEKENEKEEKNNPKP